MSTAVVRLFLVDDHVLVREGLRSLFGEHDDMEVVGEAGTVAEAVTGIADRRPDLVLVDIGLPDGSGIHLARDLRLRYRDLRVAILTMHEDEEYVQQAARAGVHGYLLKDMSATDLERAVRAVAAGDVFYPPQVSQIALRAIVETEESAARLSERETQVLVGIARGEGNKQIADRLCLSVRTVETYRGRIMKKLDIHTVAGLTRYAIAQGLLSAR